MAHVCSANWIDPMTAYSILSLIVVIVVILIVLRAFGLV
jgi:hypothetical protein